MVSTKPMRVITIMQKLQGTSLEVQCLGLHDFPAEGLLEFSPWWGN